MIPKLPIPTQAPVMDGDDTEKPHDGFAGEDPEMLHFFKIHQRAEDGQDINSQDALFLIRLIRSPIRAAINNITNPASDICPDCDSPEFTEEFDEPLRRNVRTCSKCHTQRSAPGERPD